MTFVSFFIYKNIYHRLVVAPPKSRNHKTMKEKYCEFNFTKVQNFGKVNQHYSICKAINQVLPKFSNCFDFI